MSAEDSLRELLGYGTPQLTFLGRDFTIRPDGLIPLLRYAASMGLRDPKEMEQAILSASYRLLEECVEDFPAFTAHAFKEKAQVVDINGAVAHLVSYYCARNHWAAMRLLAYVQSNLDEIDGQLIRTGGRGVAGLSAREACNLALAILLDGRDTEDRAIFLEDLNYEGNPEAEALALVRQMQAGKKPPA